MNIDNSNRINDGQSNISDNNQIVSRYFTSPKESEITIAILPQEMINKIFSFLGSDFASLNRSSRVCKTWNEQATEIYKQYCRYVGIEVVDSEAKKKINMLGKYFSFDCDSFQTIRFKAQEGDLDPNPSTTPFCPRAFTSQGQTRLKEALLQIPMACLLRIDTKYQSADVTVIENGNLEGRIDLYSNFSKVEDYCNAMRDLGYRLIFFPMEHVEFDPITAASIRSIFCISKKI
jgi:hypothetical protein